MIGSGDDVVSPKNIVLAIAGSVILVRSEWLEAGTVKKVSMEKKSVIVELEGEESAEIGDKICFFDGDNKKIVCAKVKKVKGKKVTVGVKSEKKLEKITVGSKATPKASTSVAAGTESSESPPESDKSPGKMPKKIIGFYSLGLITTANYQKIYYAAPEVETGAKTLWSTNGSGNRSLFGFGGQIALPIKKISINPGFRYRIFSPSPIQSDYKLKQENPYVETTVSASEIGLFADVQLLRKSLGKKLAINGGAGLDIAISSVTMSSKLKNDVDKSKEKDLASAKSSLNVISLRLGGSLDANLVGRFGLTSGVTLFVPLLSTGGTPSGTFADDEAKGVANPGADIKEQLGHKKSSFGAEINLGGFLSF